MTSTKQIDWSIAPEDADAAYIWGKQNIGYYKDIKYGRYMFKSTPEHGWAVGFGSPVYTPYQTSYKHFHQVYVSGW